VGLRDITDPEAVNQAIAEFDSLGRDGFLQRYGFGRARRFYVEHDGKLYDSKVLLGAAHGFQFPDQGPLASTDFSGGESTTVRKLRDLGSTIVPLSPDGAETAGIRGNQRGGRGGVIRRRLR
jgi:hypothetical protein